MQLRGDDRRKAIDRGREDVARKSKDRRFKDVGGGRGLREAGRMQSWRSRWPKAQGDRRRSEARKGKLGAASGGRRSRERGVVGGPKGRREDDGSGG
ncbi:hypothetical protein COCNU_01G016760 [Cocos nucifera]|uniref:Uncharacterized protein n=1 Tax=Cocos nucifera TaxID=13894 RepID=A0A8K0HW79_COCNU|nr:hypothetical protein COCNU_01G016760 [Cocos nucifera]